MIILRDKEFGFKSAMLGVFAPGAYQAKEAAKYGYDRDDYRDKRAEYALKGWFTPGVATYIKKHVEQMHKEGKSKAEIRKYLENENGMRYLTGIGEMALGGLGGVTTFVAHGQGLLDKLGHNRAWDQEEEEWRHHQKRFSDVLEDKEFSKKNKRTLDNADLALLGTGAAGLGLSNNTVRGSLYRSGINNIREGQLEKGSHILKQIFNKKYRHGVQNASKRKINLGKHLIEASNFGGRYNKALKVAGTAALGGLAAKKLADLNNAYDED